MKLLYSIITTRLHMRTALLGITCIVIMSACNESSNDEGLSQENIRVLTQQAVEENNQIIVTASELMSVKNAVFQQQGIDINASEQGREAGINGVNGCLPAIDDLILRDDTHRDTVIYNGTITIDYKNGSSCSIANQVRKGKVIIEYTYIVSKLAEKTFSSRETIRFENFTQDTLQINGVIASKSATHYPTSIEASAIEIQYPDGTASIWNAALICDSEQVTNVMTLSGELQGVTREGDFYTASTLAPLVISNSCASATPISGKIDVQVNGSKVTMDYGNGACDNVYTVTNLRQIQ